MTKINEMYKCEFCGNLVSVIEAGGGELVCCGQSMKIFEEKTAKQEGKEKHVPVIEVNENKVKVKVGSIEHPMEEKHYIELIQIMSGDWVVASARLSPGEKPEAEFCLENTDNLKARALCSLHGLWVS